MVDKQEFTYFYWIESKREFNFFFKLNIHLI